MQDELGQKLNSEAIRGYFNHIICSHKIRVPSLENLYEIQTQMDNGQLFESA